MPGDELTRLAAALLDVVRHRDPDFTEPDDAGRLRPFAEPGHLSIQVGRVVCCNEGGKVLKLVAHGGRVRCWVLEEGGPIDLGDGPLDWGDDPPARPELN